RGVERMTENFLVTNSSMVLRSLLFAVCIVLAFAIGNSRAQEPAWQPSAGHTQVPIWPGAAPDAQPTAGSEGSHWWPTGPGGPGGFGVYRVSRPTMTVYSPEGNNTGAAVVVFPGGGYLYLAMDAADKESCRPDFAVAIYPGHLSIAAAEWDAKQGARKFVLHYPATADKDLGLNPDIPVTRQTPPTFLLQAEDDHVDNVNDSLAYYIALKNTGVPVEM